MTRNTSIGERLKKLRNNFGKNQETVAKEIGISRARYSHYENNHVEPDIDLIKKLASYYNVTTDYLLGKNDNPNPLDSNDEFDPMNEINNLLKKYNIDQSGFFDIEKWKAMGPEGIKQLESYLNFIVNEAKKQEENGDE